MRRQQFSAFLLAAAVIMIALTLSAAATVITAQTTLAPNTTTTAAGNVTTTTVAASTTAGSVNTTTTMPTSTTTTATTEPTTGTTTTTTTITFTTVTPPTPAPTTTATTNTPAPPGSLPPIPTTGATTVSNANATVPNATAAMTTTTSEAPTNTQNPFFIIVVLNETTSLRAFRVALAAYLGLNSSDAIAMTSVDGAANEYKTGYAITVATGDADKDLAAEDKMLNTPFVRWALLGATQFTTDLPRETNTPAPPFKVKVLGKELNTPVLSAVGTFSFVCTLVVGFLWWKSRKQARERQEMIARQKEEIELAISAREEAAQGPKGLSSKYNRHQLDPVI